MGFMKQMQYKWDPQLLKRLQETELGLLKLFDKVCTKNNISYFALFGTAIGAIRHKGFMTTINLKSYPKKNGVMMSYLLLLRMMYHIIGQ